MSTYNDIKSTGSTYTPSGLANFLAQRIYDYLPEEHFYYVEDPACGNGILLDSMANVLSSHDKDFSLSGSDTSLKAVESTRKILKNKYPSKEIDIENEDFIINRRNGLFNKRLLKNLIIANPPYVRTQILGSEKSQAIAKLYNLSGRIDLYFPFIINMTESLSEGGILGVITSNRFLTTKSGESVRKFLLVNYDVIEVIDLGDTKLFDAAVLPSIFIGRKNTRRTKDESNSKFSKIYVTENSSNAIKVTSLFDILGSNKSGVYNDGNVNYTYQVEKFKRPSSYEGIWKLSSDNDDDFLNTIKSNTQCTIGDLFKVRVGIKSCADDVFFFNKWDKIEKPEDIFFHKIISQEDITTWNISPNLRSVVYPHVDDNGIKKVIDIKDYPKASRFFHAFEDKLKGRTYLTKSNRLWYEYWVPQNPVLWKHPKIVFADISVEPRFALDLSGAIVDGNCYWMTATEPSQMDLLYLFLGVANSSVMEKYHDICFNNKLYSGRRRYLSQYVEKYPLPKISSPYTAALIQAVKSYYRNGDVDLNSFQREINLLVSKAFGLVKD